jgi:hypothetical protein
MLLFLSEIHSFGEEEISQHKIDQAYEAFRGKPIDQEELRTVQLLSSSVIYKELLNADHSPSRWKEMRVMTMKKRPKDLVLEIRKTLNEDPLSIDTMGKVASFASLVSPEFEAEIANEILKHPSAGEFDIYFMDSEEFRSHFRSEPGLLRLALNTLLSEGRIEKDSARHKKWEASISKFEHIQKRREENRESATHPASRQSEQSNDAQKEKAGFGDKDKFPFNWLLSFGILILLAALTILAEVWKRTAR